MRYSLFNILPCHKCIMCSCGPYFCNSWIWLLCFLYVLAFFLIGVLHVLLLGGIIDMIKFRLAIWLFYQFVSFMTYPFCYADWLWQMYIGIPKAWRQITRWFRMCFSGSNLIVPGLLMSIMLPSFSFSFMKLIGLTLL